MSHSPVSPSSSGTWVHCTGMPEMVKDIPDVKSDSALEGDTAHWLGPELLKIPKVDGPSLIGAKAPTGHIIDDVMLYHMIPYAEDIRAVAGHALGGIHIEESIQIPRIHALAHGTPDCWYYDRTNQILYIWDLKYGWGIVEVYRCWQLIMCAVGIIDALTGGDGHMEQQIHVNMRLAQPRPPHADGPIREWSVPASDLRPYSNMLASAAEEAMSGNGKLCSGPWCKNCDGRPTCKADRYASLNALDVADIPVGHEVLNYDYELDILERAKDIITQRYNSVHDYVENLIKNGTPVPGRSIQTTPGRGSYWTKPVEEIVSLGNIFNVGLEKPTQVLTPNQAIQAGVPKEMVAGYSQRKPSGLKLVKDDLRKIQEAFRQ